MLRVCLLFENGTLQVCTVENGFLDNGESGVVSLREVLSNKKTKLRGQRIKFKLFKQLVQTIGRLHKKGVSHLALNPETIWVAGSLSQPKSLRLFLPSFSTLHDAVDLTDSDTWYQPPEFLFNSPAFFSRIESDLWALGCILFEFFTSSPLFYAPDHHS